MDFSCPLCGTVYHADVEHVGRAIRCTNCGNVVPVVGGPLQTSARQRSSVTRPRESTDNPSTATARNWIRTRNVYVGVALAIIALVATSGVYWWHQRITVARQFVWDDVGSSQSTPTSAQDAGGGPHPSAANQDPSHSERSGDGSGNQHPPQLGDGFDQFQLNNRTHAVASEPNVPEVRVRTPRPLHPNRLGECEIVLNFADTDGHGIFTFNNGTELDAVVALHGDQFSRTVYVPSHAQCSMRDIRPGSYTLTYAAGLDWSEADASFRWHKAFFQFDKIFGYSEQQTAEGVLYGERIITLHAVIGGNVARHPVSHADFLRAIGR